MDRRALALTALVFMLFVLACDSGRPVGGDTDGWNAPVVKVCVAIQCDTNADCGGASYKGGCNSKGACVMCKTDADCMAPFKGGCNQTTGFCSLCKSDADCSIAGIKLLTGRCDSAYQMCLGCDTDAECARSRGSSMKYCTAKRHCSTCTNDGHCPPGQTCDGMSCVPGSTRCSSSAQCKAPLTCEGGRCSCTTDTDCAAALGLPHGIKRWACR